MKKRMIIEGHICDVCGCIAQPKHMYVGCNNDWGYVSPKTLTIKMDGGPFYNIADCPKRPGHRMRALRYETVCPICATKLFEMFESWRDECWRDGEMDRTKRMLDFDKRFTKKEE